MPTRTETPVRPVIAPRHNGWTPERKRLFFATLAAGHSVAWACARVGLSRQAAYKARRRDPAFARQWQAAQHGARRAAEAAFLEGVPEHMRRVMLAEAVPGDFRGALVSPLDSVISVKPL